MRARIAETKKAMELAEEEGLLEALSDDMPPAASSPASPEVSGSSSAQGSPMKLEPHQPAQPTGAILQPSEDELMVSFSIFFPS